MLLYGPIYAVFQYGGRGELLANFPAYQGERSISPEIEATGRTLRGLGRVSDAIGPGNQA